MQMKALNKPCLTSSEADAVASEFAGVELCDARLEKRLDRVVRAVTRSPDQSFPRALASEADLLGFYRFMSNERISAQELAEPHFDASVDRACASEEALCLHDTTQFKFKQTYADLGPLPGKGRGFLAHCSLLLSDERSRLPLGLGTLLPWVRSESSKTRDAKGNKLNSRQIAKRGDRESDRWLRSIERVEARAKGRVSLIHVGDQETDSFELISNVVSLKRRFVFRIGRNRRLGEGHEEETLSAELTHAPVLCKREIQLSRRRASTTPRRAKRYPSRPTRTARLAISAMSMHLLRPDRRPDLPESVAVNVVHVKEIDPPEGQEPVDWLLATTEPVDTPEQILRIVDIYRARWTIEEFFKALKTGCRFEERLLETYEGLLRVLAIFLPIAWQMLHLRQLPRERPDVAAAAYLAPLQLMVLRAVSTIPLPPQPTIQEATRAIARMGGHIKNNGPPGWLTLARGMESLAQSVVGWIACKAAMDAGLEM